MVLKTTVEHLKRYLLEISHDIEKAGRGNKAAAQRVRTNTIKFAKIAKQYRKESISEGRRGGKKKTTKRKAAGKKRAAPKRKAAKKTTARKKKPTRKKTGARKRTTRKKTARRR